MSGRTQLLRQQSAPGTGFTNHRTGLSGSPVSSSSDDDALLSISRTSMADKSRQLKLILTADQQTRLLGTGLTNCDNLDDEAYFSSGAKDNGHRRTFLGRRATSFRHPRFRSGFTDCGPQQFINCDEELSPSPVLSRHPSLNRKRDTCGPRVAVNNGPNCVVRPDVLPIETGFTNCHPPRLYQRHLSDAGDLRTSMMANKISKSRSVGTGLVLSSSGGSLSSSCSTPSPGQFTTISKSSCQQAGFNDCDRSVLVARRVVSLSRNVHHGHQHANWINKSSSSEKRLGLKLSGNLVTGFTNCSIAEGSGQIFVGDLVKAINGVDVSQFSQVEIKKTIKSKLNQFDHVAIELEHSKLQLGTGFTNCWRGLAGSEFCGFDEDLDGSFLANHNQANPVQLAGKREVASRFIRKLLQR